MFGVGYLLLSPFPSATKISYAWLLEEPFYTHLHDKQPLQASLCPCPIALLKKRDGVGWSMLCSQEERQLEIGLLASSKRAFAHVQDTSVLTERGKKGELFPPWKIFL